MCTICMATRFSPSQCDYGGSPVHMQVLESLLDAPQAPGTPYTVQPGGSFSGELGPGDPEDWVGVPLTAGVTYEISLLGGSLSDPFLFVYDPTGTFRDSDDDDGTGLNSRLLFTALTTDTYFLGASAFDPAVDAGSYTLTVAIQGSTAPFSGLGEAASPHPEATLQELADYLRVGYWTDRSEVPHQFDTSFSNVIRVNTAALTPDGQQLARWALEAWAAVSDVTFKEVGLFQAPQIVFDDTAPGAYAEYTRIGNTTTRVDINIEAQWLEDFGSNLGSFSFQTYLHEVGHALGLGHMGNYNFDALYPQDTTFANDSWLVSVMSYFAQTDNLSSGGDFARLVTPMPADILAVQQMYGAPDPATSLSAGDTTYGGPNQSLGASWLGQIFDQTSNFNGGPVAFTLSDVSGYDVIDLSDLGAGSTLRLSPGASSDLAGVAKALSIAEGTQIEAAIGSAFNDTIIGSSGAEHLAGGTGADSLSGYAGHDTLEGGAGADTLAGGYGNDLLIGGNPDQLSNADGADTFIGGAGNDTVSYEGSFGSLRVDMLFPTINTFAAQGDTFDGVENLIGSQGFDNLRGTLEDNRIEGGRNVDYIFGRRGDDTLVGGIGDDVLFGGVGEDVLIGGTNQDRAQYSESLTEVLLDLADASRNTGEAAGDSYDSIEDLAGGAFNDTVFGNEGANALFGREGEDRLVGRAGNDTLNGGGNRDTLEGGAGDDVLRGGDSRDTFVFDGGADIVEDWLLDTVRFDSALWGGEARTAEEILSFASASGGQVLFDFGAGQTLQVVGALGPIGFDDLTAYIDSL